MTDKEIRALELWRKFFAEIDNPCAEDDYGREYCFFCGEYSPNHAKDCVWVAAKKLLE